MGYNSTSARNGKSMSRISKRQNLRPPSLKDEKPEFTARIIVHFHLRPQFKYMNYFIYTYIISLLTGRYEVNKLTSLPMCGFIAQLVEHRIGIAEVTGSNPVEALIFFQASSFQLLKLENSPRGSFFTFIYDRSSNI